MVSLDQIYTLDLFPVLTKIICNRKSFNVLTTDFFKIDLRALILIKFRYIDNNFIYRVFEALFQNTHFFLVIREKKQLVRDLSKNAILMIVIKIPISDLGSIQKGSTFGILRSYIYIIPFTCFN